jgi:hypothetical protein
MLVMFIELPRMHNHRKTMGWIDNLIPLLLVVIFIYID